MAGMALTAAAGGSFERLRWLASAARAVTDPRSFAEMLRLRLWDPTIQTVDVRLRALDGQVVSVRPGTADLWALETLLPAAHLPPPAIAAEGPRRIWDLGSNIGLTIAHMARLYPQASITGVEMDPGNAQLCRRNVEAWADRCAVVSAAVWHRDGNIAYGGDRGGELGFRAADDQLTAAADAPSAKAISLNTLLLAEDTHAPVDYVKMDIEGAERHVLREGTEWAARVRSIKVEVHPPYGVGDCVADLRALGFETEVEPHPGDGMPTVVGLRAGAVS